MGDKIVSCVAAEEAVVVSLIFDGNVGFGLLGFVYFGDIVDGQERMLVDDADTLLEIGDRVLVFLLLRFLLHVLNLGLCFDVDDDDDDGDNDDSFEDPDSGPSAFSVPAFNGGHFSLVGGGCFFTTLSLRLLLNLFLLLVQLLPPF